MSGPAWPFPRLMNASTPEESKDAFLSTFYTHSDAKQKLGEEWWSQMNERIQDRSSYVGPDQTTRQAANVSKWFSPEHADGGLYSRLYEIKTPVLANGDNDIIVPTENSIVLFRQLQKANSIFIPRY